MGIYFEDITGSNVDARIIGASSFGAARKPRVIYFLGLKRDDPF